MRADQVVAAASSERIQGIVDGVCAIVIWRVLRIARAQEWLDVFNCSLYQPNARDGNQCWQWKLG